MRKLIRRSGVLLVVALVAAGAVACDEDDDDAQTTDEQAEATADDGTDDGTIEVELVDFAFEGLPETVPAGTQLSIVNNSAHELHELVALRLPDDETRSVDEIVELPEEELDAMFAAPPATVLLAAPDGPQIDAVGDGTLSEPGRYLVACFIPTGVDPDEFLEAAETSNGPPDIEGGPPHVVHGMYQELIVE